MRLLNKDDTLKLEKDIIDFKLTKPKLLLHACCGPCTSGVFDQLKDYFDITILYYNPNTYPYSEYMLRYEQLIKLQKHYDFKLILTDYNEEEYLSKVIGHENDKEGESRCAICYKLRMEETVKYAKLNGFEYFTTTLSVSPYKNADKLNKIGEELESIYGIKYLYSDFKKHDGYKNSIKNSKEFDLYRQDYCGCRYSLNLKNNKLKEENI